MRRNSRCWFFRNNGLVMLGHDTKTNNSATHPIMQQTPQHHHTRHIHNNDDNISSSSSSSNNNKTPFCLSACVCSSAVGTPEHGQPLQLREREVRPGPRQAGESRHKLHDHVHGHAHRVVVLSEVDFTLLFFGHNPYVYHWTALLCSPFRTWPSRFSHCRLVGAEATALTCRQ